MLREVASAIVALFGEGCEVVLHDLADLEHSIVHLEGNVTDRKVGGCMTDLGLQRVRNGDFANEYGYLTRTDDGRVLRSCSVFLRDQKGRPAGAFCINLDIGPFLAVQRALRYVLDQPEREIRETFTSDAEEMLQRMLNEIAPGSAKPLRQLHRDERIAVVAALDEKGAFNLKRAASIVGTKLGVSRFTIYNYLNEARGNGRKRSP